MEIKEEWRKTHINPGYSVSNLGRVRHDTNGLILKPFKIGSKLDRNQYFAVDIGTQRCVRVHRLVAYAFLGNPNVKMQVNHKDGNHFNNELTNLEWVTGSENCIHAYRVLGRDRRERSKSPSARKVIRVEDGKVYGCLEDAREDVGLRAHTSISKALKNPNRRAGGFHWKYWEAENDAS